MNVGTPPPPLLAEAVAVGHGATTVLGDVSLGLAAGTCTAVVGANGSGKSTLLRALAGLSRPHGGEVLVAGRPIGSYRSRTLARHVAHLPQAPLVPAGVTVEELVGLGRHPHRRLLGAATDADAAAVEAAIQATGVHLLRHRPVSQLSGGERQRAWVAVALAQEAPVLLLDEPTTFLDIRHQLDVLALLRTLARDHGRAVLAVLHDLNQAASFADQLVVLGHGRVLAQGRPADVLDAGVVLDAFEVDAEVERRGDAVTCHFSTIH